MNARSNRIFIRGAIALATLAALTLTHPASASPIIDGSLDPAEGYTTGVPVDLVVERADGTVTGGQIWTYRDAATGDVSLWFGLPLALVDNTYGDNAVGWGKGVAPSGKNHNFMDLVDSDDLRLVVTNAARETVLDVTLDYISEDGDGGYASLGVLAVNVGDAAEVLAVSSSLAYNFNVLGYQLTTDSPLTDDDYTENSLYPGWLFGVAYEARISGDVFGDDGFGGVDIPLVHVSPNKIGKNKVYPDPGNPVPEPLTLALLAGGGATLALRRRRRRTPA
jgi:hypothetical protein